MVTDEEILEAYKILASREGVFVEPASAASVAGLYKYAQAGGLERDAVVVCVLTGHGLKDPDRAIKSVREPEAVAADFDSVAAALGY